MKEWTLTGRIVLAALAYILAFIMFINTSAFSYEDFKTSVITINIIFFIMIAIGYAISKNALASTFFVCMFFCAPSVIAYSKLGKKIFEIDVVNKFDPLTTAVLFLMVIMILLVAGKLKKLEREYLSLVSDGADEEDVKLVITNSLKIYLAFLGGIFSFALGAVVVGFVLLNIKGSTSIAVITAILGITMFLGCVFYIYRKWIK
mgnify:CR=1 FL=1